MAVEGVSRNRIQNEIIGERGNAKNKRSESNQGQTKYSDDKVSVGRGEHARPIEDSAQSGRRSRAHNRHRHAEQTPPASTPAPTQPSPSAPPATTTPAPSTTKETEGATQASGDNLKSLAARYVDQYAKETNKSLSTEEKTALTEQVYQFYSEPSRSGRLEKVVFATA